MAAGFATILGVAFGFWLRSHAHKGVQDSYGCVAYSYGVAILIWLRSHTFCGLQETYGCRVRKFLVGCIWGVAAEIATCLGVAGLPWLAVRTILRGCSLFLAVRTVSMGCR